MDDNSDIFNLVIERDTLLHQLNKSRKAEELTDVKLQMGDKLFPAHRAVLFHSSPVLKALISDRWSTTNVCLIGDQYVDVEIVEDLLSFLYTGRIDLTPDNVHPVCMAAHFLQIPTLLEPSVKYLYQFITIENVFTLFKFSTICEIEELNYSCLRFVNNSHESVFQTPQILELSFKDFKDFIVGLQKFWNKMLRENTFQCIARWTEKNLPERLTELPVLLENIPLEELPLKFLSERVFTHPLVKDSISGIETVSTALANYQTYSSDSTPLWKTNQNMIVIGGEKDNRALRLYDSHSRLWRELPDMPSKRKSFGVTVVNHQDIVICGGFLGKNTLVSTSSVIMFEWSTQTWKQLPEMPFDCSDASAAICNGDLYVVGDFSYRSDYFKKVLRFSFKTKEWESVASTNERRGRGHLIEYKNHLFAFGGASSNIEKYDPALDKWTIMAELVDNCVDAVTLHQDRIYIHYNIGYQMYNPETNSSDYFQFNITEFEASLVSLNGKLLAVGGHSKVYNTDLIAELDISKGQWFGFCRLDFVLFNHSTVVGAFY